MRAQKLLEYRPGRPFARTYCFDLRTFLFRSILEKPVTHSAAVLRGPSPLPVVSRLAFVMPPFGIVASNSAYRLGGVPSSLRSIGT
jgi:hypothetical protein